MKFGNDFGVARLAASSARKGYFRAIVFWPVVDGHLGHGRLANRSSPTWGSPHNDPQIHVLMKYPG